MDVTWGRDGGIHVAGWLGVCGGDADGLCFCCLAPILQILPPAVWYFMKVYDTM